MNVRSLLKNFTIAIISQGIASLVGVVTSLILPKVLGVEDYSYWQLFIFYSSYLGVFHLGLNDGVYLIHGGITRDEIDKRLINSQFVVEIAFQLIASVVVLAIVPFLHLDVDRTFVICLTMAYVVLKNSASYLGFVFQAMNETRLYSYSTVIERLAFCFPLVGLLLVGHTSFRWYAIAYTAASAIQLCYCAWYSRDFFGAGLLNAKASVRTAFGSIRVGISLMIANLASNLVLGVARFMVDSVWGITTFGQLSLLFSLVTFILTFVSQAAMVLFPALRQSSGAALRQFFQSSSVIMCLVMPLFYLFYYPLRFFIQGWLPNYAESLTFLMFIMPVCVFDSQMSVVYTTVFKVIRKEKLLLRINLSAVAVSTFCCAIGGYAFRSIDFVIGSAVLSVIARSAYSCKLLTRSLEAPSSTTGVMLGEVALTVLFFITSRLLSAPVALVSYSLAYAAFLLVNRKNARRSLSAIVQSVKN